MLIIDIKFRGQTYYIEGTREMVSCIWYYVDLRGSHPIDNRKVAERITTRNIKRLDILKQTKLLYSIESRELFSLQTIK